jgi:16S rRNA A1518/A1519 N6-dimethyltransferase RsmA/KsgA/DIM1 with predicted DNA glycosylase/AP lyase activity
MTVKAKKHLGQHFLTDKNICQKTFIEAIELLEGKNKLFD